MKSELQTNKLDQFIQNKEKEILAFAIKNTEEIVKTELALSEFELLLSSHLTEEESNNLTKESRKLREKNWQELSQRFNGNTEKMQEFMNSI